VNLRQLEERLNMIQEECNRLSEESDDELSATIDDKSELQCEADLLDEAETLNCDSHQMGEEGGLGFESVFNKIDQFLENGRGSGRGAGRSRSEGWSLPDTEDSPRLRDRIIEIYSCRPGPGESNHITSTQPERRSLSERGGSARGRPRSAPATTGKRLHRAHSCGSLVPRAGAGKCGGGLWDLLADKTAPLTILAA